MRHSIFFALLLALTSCEEVIVLELDESERKPVIEADLNATDGTCRVHLTKSGSFYESNDFEEIAGASLTLSANDGTTYTLTETSAGVYEVSGIAAQVGQVFDIRVSLPDGEVLTSSAEVPQPVALDSIYFLPVDGGFGGGPGGPPNGSDTLQFQISAAWPDPSGLGDNYRMKIAVNGDIESGSYLLMNDAQRDGTQINIPIIGQRALLGDVVRVELYSVSKAYYSFFSDYAAQQTRGLSEAVPFNPVGNFGTAAIGYFGIWQRSVIEKTVE